MDSVEIQAKATIAAALIIRAAVEVPSIRSGGDWWSDAAALRLRALTEYVYQTVTATRRSDPNES